MTLRGFKINEYKSLASGLNGSNSPSQLLYPPVSELFKETKLYYRAAFFPCEEVEVGGVGREKSQYVPCMSLSSSAHFLTGLLHGNPCRAFPEHVPGRGPDKKPH